MCDRQQTLNKGQKMNFRLARKDFTEVELKVIIEGWKTGGMEKTFQGNGHAGMHTAIRGGSEMLNPLDGMSLLGVCLT